MHNKGKYKDVIKYRKDTKSQGRNEIFWMLNFIQSYSHLDPGNKKYWKTKEDYAINSCFISRLSVFDSISPFCFHAGFSVSFLGSFAKLRKATISFVMSVRLTVRPSSWNDSARTGRIFMKFDIWEYFENLSRTFSAIKIGQEIRVLYVKTTLHFLSYLANFFLDWEMFQTNVVEKTKTHILCPVTFFKIVSFMR
jgi:hypothetical protein